MLLPGMRIIALVVTYAHRAFFLKASYKNYTIMRENSWRNFCNKKRQMVAAKIIFN
jgi:hypothetical protein